MKLRNKYSNKRHTNNKTFFRIAGVVLLLAGIIFTGIGLISFFAAFGSFAPPKYFWCAFIGLPLLALGAASLNLGFMGNMANYSSHEITPVIGEAAEHLAEKISDGLNGGNVEDRIRNLDRLKSQSLITDLEYQRKRKEILDDL